MLVVFEQVSPNSALLLLEKTSPSPKLTPLVEPVAVLGCLNKQTNDLIEPQSHIVYPFFKGINSQIFLSVIFAY